MVPRPGRSTCLEELMNGLFYWDTSKMFIKKFCLLIKLKLLSDFQIQTKFSDADRNTDSRPDDQ